MRDVYTYGDPCHTDSSSDLTPRKFSYVTNANQCHVLVHHAPRITQTDHLSNRRRILYNAREKKTPRPQLLATTVYLPRFRPKGLSRGQDDLDRGVLEVHRRSHDIVAPPAWRIDIVEREREEDHECAER